MKRREFLLTTLAIPLVAACTKDETESGGSKNKNVQVLTPIDSDSNIYGVVTDNKGNYLQGVVVSDGYNVTITDENGVYQMTSSSYSYHVYVTIPAEYEVPMADDLPCFWQVLTPGKERYDFELTPLAGGPETDFNLFCIADPQCQTTSHVDRFKNETCPDLRAEVAKQTLPCYGVVLGDIGWNNTSTNYNATIFPLMKAAMTESRCGLPLFMVIGNHDNKVISNSSYSVAMDIDAQRDFEDMFGPINYSFDRGDAHIVVMDNIYFTNQGTYNMGFRDDQVKWLEQDLNYMPDGKLLILCVHHPMRSYTSSTYVNAKNVFDLCHAHSSFYYIMSGHVHCQEFVKDSNHYERNHGAACGAWWRATICADGAPNGYEVYRINGNQITNWYYKGTDCDADFQIRMYHASDSFMKNYTPNYQFKYTGSSQIIANIWNCDSDWKVEVYEDGVYTGNMSGGNYNDRDAWASGYFMGVLGRSTGSDYDKDNKQHYWYYTLKNNPTNVEIVATDPYGNVYRQSKFTSNTSEDWPVAP